MDSILIFERDRIYRIIRIFLFPVSGRNREYATCFAESVSCHRHTSFNLMLAIDADDSALERIVSSFPPSGGRYLHGFFRKPCKILFILLILSPKKNRQESISLIQTPFATFSAISFFSVSLLTLPESPTAGNSATTSRRSGSLYMASFFPLRNATISSKVNFWPALGIT